MLATMAAAGFVICLYLAYANKIGGQEENLFLIIYNLPTWLTFPLFLVTQTAGAGGFFVIVFVIALLRKLALSARVFVAGSLAFVLAYAFKFLVARPRPNFLIQNIVARYDHQADYSFPSGHSAVATAVAVTLWPFVPKKHRWLLATWVGLVMLSRVNLGVHTPLDVAGGFCLGAIAAITTASVINRTKKHKNY